jgi:hypothetical protein
LLSLAKQGLLIELLVVSHGLVFEKELQEIRKEKRGNKVYAVRELFN